MDAVRTGALVLMTTVLLASCNADDPVGEAADAICEAIDAEMSDVAAFEGYELAIAQERRDGMDEDELRKALDARCGRAIVAVSAAAADPAKPARSEDDENVATSQEPEPEQEAVDVREIDWASETWLTSCSVESEQQADDTYSRHPVTLTVPDEGGRWYHGNRLEVADGVPLYEVYGAEVVYGDVTGDGVDDAIFTTVCSQGNIEVATLEVWEGGTEPVHLPEVLSFFRDGMVERVETLDGHLRVHSAEASLPDNMEHLDGFLLEVVTDYQWSDGTWNASEIERRDLGRASPAQPERAGRFTDPEATWIGDAFQMPSGNVYCGLIDWGDADPPYLDCVIVSGMNPIPTDYDCPVDWTGIGMGMADDAGPNCAADTWVGQVQPSSYPTLGYGQTWTYDEITCRSEESGLSCENRSGGAFSLARNSWSAR